MDCGCLFHAVGIFLFLSHESCRCEAVKHRDIAITGFKSATDAIATNLETTFEFVSCQI